MENSVVIIDDIISWAIILPLWQDDVVRRILVYGKKPLDTQDCSEILALAKEELKPALAPDNVTTVPPVCGVLRRYLSRSTPGTKQ